MSRQVAISVDGSLMAVRDYDGDSWWVFQIPSTGLRYQSDLPSDGWTRLFPATERDLMAEELSRIGSELESAADALQRLQATASRVKEGDNGAKLGS